jgi:hypothetical protein
VPDDELLRRQWESRRPPRRRTVRAKILSDLVESGDADEDEVQLYDIERSPESKRRVKAQQSYAGQYLRHLRHLAARFQDRKRTP